MRSTNTLADGKGNDAVVPQPVGDLCGGSFAVTGRWLARGCSRCIPFASRNQLNRYRPGYRGWFVGCLRRNCHIGPLKPSGTSLKRIVVRDLKSARRKFRLTFASVTKHTL